MAAAQRRALGLGGALLLLAGCGGRSELFELDGAGTATESGGTATGTDASGGKNAGGGAGVGGQPAHRTGQVDLLLTIDNSISMTDKQELLAEALPTLLERLAKGSSEFSPVSDIHIGVITSSLGAHGGQTCADNLGDDKAQLLAKVRLPDASFPYQTWNDSGFLAWDPDSRRSPPGEDSLDDLSAALKNMVLSAGQTGCGFEASLEAWYRFLIDPDPPESIPQVTDRKGFTTPLVSANPKQNPVLVQRAAFLRPDSALVLLMLSDENDCSIMDAGQGWLVGTQSLDGRGNAFHMPRATSVCETNPNDPCCQSCASAPSEGCTSPQSDPGCTPAFLTLESDNLNLRCWDQKRRFGVDLLYPISRYVEGLTQTTIVRQSGEEARNPIFPRGGRTQSQVFLSAIVGVPWQDLATKASLVPQAPLEYLNHEELTAQDRWSLVLGEEEDPATGTPATPPRDKLMFETNLDREALFGEVSHPLLGRRAALASSSSAGLPNAINGRESDFSDGSELQHACIFELSTPRDCADPSPSCACRPSDAQHKDAVCKGTIQTHAKAWPGVRELRVLRAFGDLTGNAIPASICPKTLGSPDSGGGYGPVISALVNRLQSVLLP